MHAASTTESPRFAEPTSLGLFGLAIGCAALLPVAFGVKAAFTPEALRTCALFCLVFGFGCQLIAGLMSFANKILPEGATGDNSAIKGWQAESDLSQGPISNLTDRAAAMNNEI